MSGGFEMLPWHAPQWHRIDAMEDAGRLAHALLLTGASGLGKRQFADRLCARLLCEDPRTRPCGHYASCTRVGPGAHPDLMRLTLDDGERATLGVDEVRSLTSTASLTARGGRGRKVAIIDPADALTMPAANTLLKTLEEPAGDTVLVLLATRPQALPATIRSRCQRIQFTVPDPADAQPWLEQQADADWPGALRAAAGAPLAALALVNASGLARLDELCQQLLELAGPSGSPLPHAARGKREPPEQLAGDRWWLAGDLLRIANRQPPRRIADGVARQGAGVRLDCRRLYAIYDRCTEFVRLVATHGAAGTAIQLDALACAWQQALTGKR